MRIYIHAKHVNGNDVNGNPRRMFLVYELRNGDFSMIDILWEGYRGNEVVTEKYPDALPVYTPLEMPPAMYRQYKKLLK